MGTCVVLLCYFVVWLGCHFIVLLLFFVMYFTFINGKVAIGKSAEESDTTHVGRVTMHSDPFSYAKRSVWIEEKDMITPNQASGDAVPKTEQNDSGISSLSTSPVRGWNWNHCYNRNQSAFFASHWTPDVNRQTNIQLDTVLLSWYTAYEKYAKSWVQYQIEKREMEDDQSEATIKPTLVPRKNLPPRLAAKFAEENEIRHNTSMYHGKPLCAFCRKNGEPRSFYENHQLKNEEGIVTCPILRAFKCPICAATGDNAHTESYCPSKQHDRAPCVRRGRDSTGRLRAKYW